MVNRINYCYAETVRNELILKPKRGNMYKYEFVKIELKSGLFSRKPREDYQKVISSYANKGWRFKQIFAPATSGHGSSSYFELIFEKEI